MFPRNSSGFSPEKDPKAAGTGNFLCADGHLEAPQPVFGGGQDGHDRLLRRIIHWHSGWFLIVVAGGLFPGEA